MVELELDDCVTATVMPLTPIVPLAMAETPGMAAMAVARSSPRVLADDTVEEISAAEALPPAGGTISAVNFVPPPAWRLRKRREGAEAVTVTASAGTPATVAMDPATPASKAASSVVFAAKSAKSTPATFICTVTVSTSAAVGAAVGEDAGAGVPAGAGVAGAGVAGDGVAEGSAGAGVAGAGVAGAGVAGAGVAKAEVGADDGAEVGDDVGAEVGAEVGADVSAPARAAQRPSMRMDARATILAERLLKAPGVSLTCHCGTTSH